MTFTTAPIYNLSGAPWRNRIQLYDAPFSLRKADSFTLYLNGQPSYIRGQAAKPIFDDTKNWFDPTSPGAGVKVRNAGVTIQVLSENGTSVKVRFGSKAPAPTS